DGDGDDYGDQRRPKLHQGCESDRARARRRTGCGWRGAGDHHRSGRRARAGWATGSRAGPADESGQALNFIVSNSNTALFSSQPAVAAKGTLTFTPAAHANVTATA